MESDIQDKPVPFGGVPAPVDAGPMLPEVLAARVAAEKAAHPAYIMAADGTVMTASEAAAEARGWRKAIAALQDGERIAKWLGLKATGERSQRGAISYLRPAVEYLEAIEGDDR